MQTRARKAGPGLLVRKSICISLSPGAMFALAFLRMPARASVAFLSCTGCEQRSGVEGVVPTMKVDASHKRRFALPLASCSLTTCESGSQQERHALLRDVASGFHADVGVSRCPPLLCASTAGHVDMEQTTEEEAPAVDTAGDDGAETGPLGSSDASAKRTAEDAAPAEAKKKRKLPQAVADAAQAAQTGGTSGSKLPTFAGPKDSDNTDAAPSPAASKPKPQDKAAAKPKAAKPSRGFDGGDDDDDDPEDDEQLAPRARSGGSRGGASGSGAAAAAAAAYSQLLSGCVIVLSGVQNPERGEFREALIAMGAQYRPDWTRDSTLLVRVVDGDGTLSRRTRAVFPHARTNA